MRRVACAIPILAGLCTVCTAQGTGPVIEAPGEGIIEVAPDEIVFAASARFSETSLTAGNERATAMRRTLEDGLNDLNLKPLRVSPVRVHLESLKVPIVTAEVDLVFAAAPDGRVSMTRDAVTDLAERLRKLAVATDLSIQFKEVAVLDPESIEQDAVARATENALFLANAVGALVDARVAEVNRVTIERVTWRGTRPVADNTFVWPPDLRCVAHVQVEYEYEFAANR